MTNEDRQLLAQKRKELQDGTLARTSRVCGGRGVQSITVKNGQGEVLMQFRGGS